MNKKSCSDWKDPDLFSVINNTYERKRLKTITSLTNYFIKIVNSKLSLFIIGFDWFGLVWFLCLLAYQLLLVI